MVQNMSDMSALENYTLAIIEKSTTTSNNSQTNACNSGKKRNTRSTAAELNQAFSKDSWSQSLSDSCDNRLNGFKSFSLLDSDESASQKDRIRNVKLPKACTQLSNSQLPAFDGSCIENGTCVSSSYTSSSMTSSTQLSSTYEPSGKIAASIPASLSPLEANSQRQTRSKSSIKITPLNPAGSIVNPQSSSINVASLAFQPVANVEVLISSDEELSHEISEDDSSDESTSSKKQKRSSQTDNGQSSFCNGGLLTTQSVIVNTICHDGDRSNSDKAQSDASSSSVGVNGNGLEEDELMSVDKAIVSPDTEDSFIMNTNNNNKGSLLFFCFFLRIGLVWSSNFTRFYI